MSINSWPRHPKPFVSFQSQVESSKWSASSVPPTLISRITPTSSLWMSIIQYWLHPNLRGYQAVRSIVRSLRKQLISKHLLQHPRYPTNPNRLRAQVNLWLYVCRVVHLTTQSMARASLPNQSLPTSKSSCTMSPVFFVWFSFDLCSA